MDWQGWTQTLTEVLGLKGSPVAVTYAFEAPTNASSTGKHWVCEAWSKAREGEVIDLTAETSTCPGGTWHLGLGPRPAGEGDRALKKFLVEGEKLFCSIAVFHRAMALQVQPPSGLAEHVILCPLEKAEQQPDVVLFIVNAEQACRLLQLATYWTGMNPRTEMVGSACYMAVAYPLVSGEINVSFLDWTARRMRRCPADELIVSVPLHRMPEIVRAIPHCTAGTAKVEYPPEFRELMRGEGT